MKDLLDLLDPLDLDVTVNPTVSDIEEIQIQLPDDVIMVWYKPGAGYEVHPTRNRPFLSGCVGEHYDELEEVLERIEELVNG